MALSKTLKQASRANLLLRRTAAVPAPSSLRPFQTSTTLLATPDQAQESKPTSQEKKKQGVTGNGSPQPKISNLSVPGVDKSKGLTEEQKKEVEEHNRDFENKFDHAASSQGDKVDKKFWKGE